MKYLSRDERGAMPIVIGLLVVAVVAVVGLAVYSYGNNKQAATPSASPTPTPSSQTDTDLVTQAAKAYDTQSANHTISGVIIAGSNAKGYGMPSGAPSGYEFIAHKDNGTWKIIHRGQEAPGKALGEQYDLPTDWYSTTY
jgi:FlaG/FlaF family flagellin (archaellin)